MNNKDKAQVVWAVLYVRDSYTPMTVALYDNEKAARAHLAAEPGWDDLEVDSFVIHSSYQAYWEMRAREQFVKRARLSTRPLPEPPIFPGHESPTADE